MAQWLHSAGASFNATDTAGRQGGQTAAPRLLLGSPRPRPVAAQRGRLYRRHQQRRTDTTTPRLLRRAPRPRPQWLHTARAPLSTPPTAIKTHRCTSPVLRRRGTSTYFSPVAAQRGRLSRRHQQRWRHTTAPCLRERSARDGAVALCSLRADVTLKDDDGNTPAQVLVRCSHGMVSTSRLRSTLACLVRWAQGCRLKSDEPP